MVASVDHPGRRRPDDGVRPAPASPPTPIADAPPLGEDRDGNESRRPPVTDRRTALQPRILRVRHRVGAPPHLGLLTVGGLTVPCALGRSGLTRFKREGDGATPVGRFDLLWGWWRGERGLPPQASIDLSPTPADLGWCDDPGDGRYNRAVRLPFRPSHETLRRDDRLYDVVIVLDANLRRRSLGRGSAIFFHVARDGFEPTAGCVALAPDDMRRVLARLGPRPTMVIG